MCQTEVSFICPIGIFSDRETLELLTVSLSFEDLLPCLTFTCFCFICGTVPLVCNSDYRKCCGLSEPYFPSSGWMSPPICMCGLPHMSFNFPVDLSYHGLLNTWPYMSHFKSKIKRPVFQKNSTKWGQRFVLCVSWICVFSYFSS